jgi:hypothetical protein
MHTQIFIGSCEWKESLRTPNHTYLPQIKSDLLEIFQSAGWIRAAKDIVQWQAILKTFMNHRGSIKIKYFLAGLSDLHSEEWNFSIELVLYIYVPM